MIEWTLILAMYVGLGDYVQVKTEHTFETKAACMHQGKTIKGLIKGDVKVTYLGYWEKSYIQIKCKPVEIS